MEIRTFIENYREAFGEKAELPIAFWYSDMPIEQTEKIGGCFFKGLKEVRDGKIISLDAGTIGCGGGKFYTGFSGMPEHIPHFVSVKEKYKQTPELVVDYIQDLNVPLATGKFLHFARLDQISDFQQAEGILFLATPDILSGLTTWAYFDNNDKETVVAPFGSGCCAVVTRTIIENRKNGKSTFIGFFDPSVRPWFEPNLLSYTIPMSRFKEMYYTMKDSCLFNTPAWGKIKERINKRDECL